MREQLIAAACEVAGLARKHAADVDQEARFPKEAFDALAAARLLGASIPTTHSGPGCSVRELTEICRILGSACASTACIYAMHQIQLQCLARHGLGVPFFDAYLRELAQTQALVASATSELGIGGALRRSGVAIEADGSRFQLFKRCPAISYCKQADAILVSARRSPGAEAGDQVLALLRTSDCELQVGHDWDSLGLRGTCTPSVDLRGSGAMEQILPAPLAVISSMTLVPFAHVSWASGWLGLAQDAAAIARHTVSSGGSSEVGARALAEAHRDLHALQAIVSEGIRELESLYGSAERDGMLFSLDFIRASNDLKVLAADLTSRVCQGSLRASGLRGYTNNSTGSLGRHVRDALGAVVMIANERLLAANTQFLLTPPQD